MFKNDQFKTNYDLTGRLSPAHTLTLYDISAPTHVEFGVESGACTGVHRSCIGRSCTQGHAHKGHAHRGMHRSMFFDLQYSKVFEQRSRSTLA